jgi:hypothetical protein
VAGDRSQRGGAGYRLAADLDQIDAVRLERLVTDAAGKAPEAALAAYDWALALWRGSPFGDVAYADRVGFPDGPWWCELGPRRGRRRRGRRARARGRARRSRGGGFAGGGPLRPPSST